MDELLNLIGTNEPVLSLIIGGIIGLIVETIFKPSRRTFGGVIVGAIGAFGAGWLYGQIGIPIDRYFPISRYLPDWLPVELLIPAVGGLVLVSLFRFYRNDVT